MPVATYGDFYGVLLVIAREERAEPPWPLNGQAAHDATAQPRQTHDLTCVTYDMQRDVHKNAVLCTPMVFPVCRRRRPRTFCESERMHGLQAI